MSEDQNRDPDRGLMSDDGASIMPDTSRPAEASGTAEKQPADARPDPKDSGDTGTAQAGDGDAAPTAEVDQEAVAKHRAAKRARIRKRREEALRQQGLMPDSVEPGPKKSLGGSALPAIRPEVTADTPALRAERVEAIRRDLVRRRRRKGGGMLLKLWAFIAVPTMLVAWFMWFEASDLYQSQSKFQVQTSDMAAGSGGLLGAMMGGGGGVVYDSIAVQEFILSRDVLRRLDTEYGWIAHFQNPELDWFHALDSEASFEDSFGHYQDMVSVSFDPTEGIIEMDLVAATPDDSRRFSKAIISYAEEMVDTLADPIREDAMRDSERNLAESEENLKGAQLAEAEVRKKLDIFSVEGEVSAELSIIAGLETRLEELRGRLENLRRVTSETDPRVERIRNQVATLENQIVERRKNVTGGEGLGRDSLADINAELARAQVDVQAALAIFTAALETREAARADAARQHRYLSVVIQPSVPDEANYPQKWKQTGLAFLIFLGIYIVVSLTVSLIREQASI